MSGVNWTKDQQKVIQTHNRNLLVSAAAGSGKTAVLVQRIIDMITNPDHPMDVDELLVVTFTNAAAAEMRERVASALSTLLDEYPQDRHLKRQNTLVHQAQITTIDSFCLYVIRNYFNQLDIDPSFRIGDEGELKLLLADVMEEMLEEYYQSGNAEFSEFVETYARGKADTGIDEYIYQVHNFSRSTPWPKEWIAQCRREILLEHADKLEDMPWMQYLMRDIKRQGEELLTLIGDAKALCMEENGPEAYLPAFLDDEALVKQILEAETFTTLSDILSKAGNLTRLKAIRSKEVDPEKKETASAIRKQVKQVLEKLRKLYAVGSSEDVLSSMKGCQKAVLTLLDLAEDFSERYQTAKKEKNLVDFSDLEHFAIEILLKEESEDTENEGQTKRMVPTEAAKQLSSQFREILIDEYQDSNLVQETLLNSISRERDGNPNLFMVGDVKQSIYRFRLARPELFMQKYETYTKEDSLYQKIELHQNFRSRREVLESANQVFWKLMIKSIGGIVYTEDQALHVGAGFAPAPEGLQSFQTNYRTELLLCDTTDAEKGAFFKEGESAQTGERTGEQDIEEFTAKEAEAHMIAEQIRAITDAETGMMVWDKREKGYRRAKYQDIAVLCRSMAGWAEVFTNVFMSMEIPAVAETRTGYFNTIEVETILSFLAVLDNPMQDIPLASVMHSPIGNFSDTELAELMASYKKMAQKGQDTGLYGAFSAVIYGVPVKDEAELEAELGAKFETEWEYYLAQAEKESAVTESAITENAVAESAVVESAVIENAVTESSIAEYEKIQEEEREESKRVFPVIEQALTEKLQKLEALFVSLRKKASYLPIHELLYAVFEETGYYRYVKAMPSGQTRAANLDMLAEKAAAYEATSYRGVFHFIRYIEKLKKYDTDFGEASLIGEEDNAVRMMSVHKSKGLEFPIVFLAGMGKKFNRTDLYGKVLIDPEMGVATDYLDLEHRVRFATLKKQVLKRRLEVENLGEELRVLYVAMTRAKEKLIMTAALSGIEKKVEKWVGKNRKEMLFTTISSADSYLDWILMSLPGELEHILKEEHTSFGWIDVQKRSLQDLVEGEVVQQAERKLRKEELLDFDIEKEYDATMREHLERVMNFTYPHEADISLHTKMAVSELKKKTYQMDIEEAEFLPSLPEFMKGKDETREIGGIREVGKIGDSVENGAEHTIGNASAIGKRQKTSGAERGVMYHHVLELLPMQEIESDLGRVLEETQKQDVMVWIEKKIQALVLAGKISEEEQKIVEYASLAEYILSSFGQRMIQAAQKGQLYRETQFVMGVMAKEIPGLADSDEYVVVQGVIDAWFVEEDEIVLVDYKTDRVYRGQEAVLIERYQAQLAYYEKALQQMMQKKVKEKWIYSFALGKAVKVP